MPRQGPEKNAMSGHPIRVTGLQDLRLGLVQRDLLSHGGLPSTWKYLCGGFSLNDFWALKTRPNLGLGIQTTEKPEKKLHHTPSHKRRGVFRQPVTKKTNNMPPPPQ